MRIFDVAVLGVVLFGAVAAVSLLALLKPAWRPRAGLGLKAGLAGFAVTMGIAMATTPPKAVLDAEAAARAARAEQSAKDKTATEAAAAEARRVTAQAETEKQVKPETAKAAEAAAVQEKAQNQARKQTLEAQIDWSNRLWALSTLTAGYIRGGDLDGLANARYKAGELFIEASQWEKADAKLAYICSQAADALKNAIIAARDGNMNGKPDSYSTQLQRWNSHHDQCTATARDLRGEPPLNKAKTAG
jgi:hypothetical protein